MIITPYSGINEADQDIADFPALKHHFKFNEAVDATHLVDEVTGGTLALDTTLPLTQDGYGLNDVVGTTGGTLVWTAVDAYVLMLLTVKNNDDATATTFRIGGTTNRVSAGTAPSVNDASGSQNAGTSLTRPYNVINTMGTLAWPAAIATPNIISLEALSTGTTITVNAAAGANEITAFTPAVGNWGSSDETTYYDLQVWKFASQPSTNDLKSAAGWVRHAVASGNKALYPAFKGRT